MATYNKFSQFTEDLGKKVHNLDADTLKIMLTNTAPVAGNSVFADLVEIAAGNGYSAGGTAVGSPDYEQVAGTAKMAGLDVTFTASGGSIGPFRYAVFYNDTPTSPADPLIAWWDRGSALTLLDGDSITIDFADNTAIFSIA